MYFLNNPVSAQLSDDTNRNLIVCGNFSPTGTIHELLKTLFVYDVTYSSRSDSHVEIIYRLRFLVETNGLMLLVNIYLWHHHKCNVLSFWAYVYNTQRIFSHIFS